MHTAAVMSVHNRSSSLGSVPLLCEATSALDLLVLTVAQVSVIVIRGACAGVGTIGGLWLEVGLRMLGLRSRDIHGGRREACGGGGRTGKGQD
jgi:hypothetical protein